MVSSEEIGRAIAAARKREHLTQEELAALSGISERTLRNIENGTGRTSLETVLRVAGSVGVSIRLED
ncbi:helix-turn-helix transcriptional regulator [Actinomycetaceae bacterium WB03_NA08]|uniref:Helix-turn-helix transcriptional regulator n=1 Tax=Scrofimicrobium canadense TaxID=2652290 RepID=A0A6N7VPJ2_9ACTO|nr:helix-turn-helix transcriptional regulator [Scrofimicrobium canadense]